MDTRHGEIEVSVDGRIIIARYIGLFNQEGAGAELDKLKAAIVALTPGPFVMLVDDIRLEGGTPDAYDEVERFNHWLQDYPMVAKATVVESAVKLKILESRIPARRQQNSQAFVSIDEAKAWLASQLALHSR